MNRFNVLVGGLFIASSSLLGCASPDPSDGESEGQTGSTTAALSQLPLPNGGTELLAGRCNNDGFIVEDGRVARLGQDIGPDVTGISVRARVSMDQSVCHNVKTWTPLVQYVCNVNSAEGNTVDSALGTYVGRVSGPSEWINLVQTQYPDEAVTDGLYLGYAKFAGRADLSVFPAGDPCPKSAPADIPLTRIECCATAPAP